MRVAVDCVVITYYHYGAYQANSPQVNRWQGPS